MYDLGIFHFVTWQKLIIYHLTLYNTHTAMCSYTPVAIIDYLAWDFPVETHFDLIIFALSQLVAYDWYECTQQTAPNTIDKKNC